MGSSKRAALRLVVYIKCLGGEPLPFAHVDYREYAAALQSQYDKLKQTLDSVTVQEARKAGRLLIRRKSLTVTMEKALPAIPPNPLGIGHSHDPSNTMPSTEREGNASELCLRKPEKLRQRAIVKDLRNCQRKMRHLDYLSALKHACRLGDDINIYPCHLCGGLHVGHNPSSEKVKERKKVSRRLNVIVKRLEVLDRERHYLESERRTLIAGHAGLCSSPLEAVPEKNIRQLRHFRGLLARLLVEGSCLF